MIRALFADTVERHISPARYRVEKVAHVAIIAVFVPALLAGLAYWAVGLAMALRSGEVRVADKARDLGLALVPFALAWSVPWGLVLFAVCFLLPIRD